MAGYFSFNRMISTTLVKVVYFLGFLALSSLSITLIVWAGLRLNNANIARDLGWRYVVYGGAALIVGNIVWRMICELWIVLFSINDHLSLNNQVISVRQVQRIPETQFVERRTSIRDRRVSDFANETPVREVEQKDTQFQGPRTASVLGLS
jgi:hypothetical protein